jgi:predicted nucleic acid-binding protein
LQTFPGFSPTLGTPLYVNLAVAAGAGYLVSRDRDLLDLMDQATAVGKEFGQRFPGLRIMDPAAFLREFSARENETHPSEEAAS